MPVITKIEVDPEIQKQFDELLVLLKNRVSAQSVELVQNAFNLAYEAHRGMVRKSGEPYIIHPLAVARIVVEEMGMGVRSVVAALLHDVVEDTHYSIDDIRAQFGDQIANVVDGLTKISGVFDANVSVQAVNFRKILLTLVDDVRVILIKLADRLHNMRTLESMPRNKQIKIAGETIYLFAPLAHRLGFFALKCELEDLSLKYRYPEVYEELKNKIQAKEKTRDFYVENFAAPLTKKFEENHIKYQISRAPLSVYAIWYSMQFENKSFEEIYDLLRINIVFEPTPDIPEKFQCWSIYSLITDVYMPKPEMIRDFLTRPKANGYEALHATFMGPNGKWVEVHIRSQRMQQIAERGLSAYFSYKLEHPDHEGEIDKWLGHVKELLQTPEEDALEFLDEFKLNLYSSEIMVFTPKGNIKTMPKDSTVLDFAYEIHSEIGNKALAAKVNHKLVPLNEKLNSGDQVEILTSDKSRVTYEWLDFVRTAKARSTIKKSLKSEVRNRIRKGKEILDRHLAELNLQPESALFKKMFQAYKVHSKDELYSKIALGVIQLNDLEKVLTHKARNKIVRYWKLQFLKTLPWSKKDTADKAKKEKDDDKVIFSDGQDNREYKIASCCKPIPGDEVIGHSAPKGRVIIHKANCTNAIKIMSRHGNLIIPVKWATHHKLSFLIRIGIEGVDNQNIYKDITTIIADKLDVRIRTMNFDSHDGVFTGTLDLYIHDTKDLNNLIMDIGKIKGIENVRRLDISEE